MTGTGVRAAERSALSQGVSQLAAGSGSVVLVLGEPGCGKTFLIRDALDGHPAQVTSAWAAEHSAERFALWWGIAKTLQRSRPGPDVDRLLQVLGRLRDQHDGAPPADLLAQGAELLGALATEQPLMLVIDDAHRLDGPSAELLDRVLPLTQNAPLLLVLAGRPVSGGGFSLSTMAHGLRGQRRVTLVQLGPLSEAEVTELAVALIGDEPAPVRRAARACGGNPLVLRHLALAGQGEDAWGSAGSTVRLLLVDRARAVDESGVVAVLAVVGRPATVSLLAHASGHDHARLELALVTALATGFVERRGRLGLYCLSYPLLRDAVLATLEPELLQQIHLDVAAALQRDGGAWSGQRAEAARHIVASGIGGLQAAQACLDAALAEEELRAVDEAEELATYGLDSGCDDARVRVQLMRVLGRCHGRTARAVSARDLLQRAVVLAREALPPLEYAEAVADLAGVDMSFVAVPAHRVEQLEEALACVDALADEQRTQPQVVALRALLLAFLSVGLYYTDLDRSRACAEESTEVALRSGDARAIAVAYDCWSFAAVGSSWSARRADMARWRDSDGTGLEAPGSIVGSALIRGDRAALDVALARLGHQRMALPSTRGQGMVEVARLSRAVLDGNTPEVGRLTDVVRACPNPDVAAVGAVVELLWRFHSGVQREVSMDALAAVLPTPSLARLFMTAAVVSDVINGEPGAMDSLRGLSQWRAELLSPRPDLAADVSMVLLAVIGGSLGDEEMCRTAIRALSPYCDEFTIVSWVVCAGPVGWFLAWAHFGLGEYDAALAANARAESASRRLGSPVWLTQCLIQRAGFLAERRHPDVDDVIAAAREAATATELPMLVRRATALVSPAPSIPAEPGGRHRQILTLAAEGMTNEQIARTLFLSVSTVERQLTQLYRSMRVRNRAEAVAALQASVTGDEAAGAQPR